jgi:hypothetical protein
MWAGLQAMAIVDSEKTSSDIFSPLSGGREYVRLVRLIRSDSNLARLERIIETFVKYGTSTFDDKA